MFVKTLMRDCAEELQTNAITIILQSIEIQTTPDVIHSCVCVYWKCAAPTSTNPKPREQSNRSTMVCSSYWSTIKEEAVSVQTTSWWWCHFMKNRILRVDSYYFQKDTKSKRWMNCTTTWDSKPLNIHLQWTSILSPHIQPGIKHMWLKHSHVNWYVRVWISPNSNGVKVDMNISLCRPLLLWTLTEKHKSNWKKSINKLVYAYSSALKWLATPILPFVWGCWGCLLSAVISKTIWRTGKRYEWSVCHRQSKLKNLTRNKESQLHFKPPHIPILPAARKWTALESRMVLEIKYPLVEDRVGTPGTVSIPSVVFWRRPHRGVKYTCWKPAWWENRLTCRRLAGWTPTPCLPLPLPERCWSWWDILPAVSEGETPTKAFDLQPAWHPFLLQATPVSHTSGLSPWQPHLQFSQTGLTIAWWTVCGLYLDDRPLHNT